MSTTIGLVWILTYQEDSKRVAYTFHQELIIGELFITYIKHFWWVEVWKQIHHTKESNNYENSFQMQEAHSDSHSKTKYLPEPEHKV